MKASCHIAILTIGGSISVTYQDQYLTQTPPRICAAFLVRTLLLWAEKTANLVSSSARIPHLFIEVDEGLRLAANRSSSLNGL